MKLKALSVTMLTLLLISTVTLAFNVDGGYVLADGSWNIETVDSTGVVGLYSSIALDSGDNPHISYERDADFDLRYAYYDGSSWHMETEQPTNLVWD